MNKIFGYARVSTVDQNLDTQIDLLEKYGVIKQLAKYSKTHDYIFVTSFD